MSYVRYVDVETSNGWRARREERGRKEEKSRVQAQKQREREESALAEKMKTVEDEKRVNEETGRSEHSKTIEHATETPITQQPITDETLDEMSRQVYGASQKIDKGQREKGFSVTWFKSMKWRLIPRLRLTESFQYDRNWAYDSNTRDFANTEVNALYSPIDPLKNNEFRLLQIQPANDKDDPLICKLAPYPSCKECPQYQALSWTWGSTQLTEDHWEPISIMIENTNRLVKYWIPTVGHRALLSIRSLKGSNSQDSISSARTDTANQSIYLWIDYICINQRSLSEKAQQVRLMGHIYHHASAVIAYVGGVDQTSTALSTAIAEMQSLTPQTPKQQEKVATLLGAFMLRPWFSRTWVIQEVLQARHIWILCGDSVLNWEDLALLYYTVHFTGQRLFATGHAWKIGGDRIAGNLIDLRAWYRAQPPSKNVSGQVNAKESFPSIGRLDYADLADVLYETWSYGCRWERDKVFALNSLFKYDLLPVELTPEYEISDGTVFRRVNRFLKRKCDCRVFGKGSYFNSE